MLPWLAIMQLLHNIAFITQQGTGRVTCITNFPLTLAMFHIGFLVWGGGGAGVVGKGGGGNNVIFMLLAM